MKKSVLFKQLLAVILGIQTALSGYPTTASAQEEPETELPVQEAEEAAEEAGITEVLSEEDTAPENAEEAAMENSEDIAEEETEEETEVPVMRTPVLHAAEDLLLTDGKIVFSVWAEEGFYDVLEFIFNGETVLIEQNEQGAYVLAVDPEELDEGTYPVTVRYEGSEEYEPAELHEEIILLRKTVHEQELPEPEIAGKTVTLFRYEPAETDGEELPEDEPSQQLPAEMPELDGSDAYSLNIPLSKDPGLSIVSAVYDTGTDDGTFNITLRSSYSNADFLFVTAVKDGVSYYLNMTDEPAVKNTNYTVPVKFDLPEGEYELHTAVLHGTSGAEISSDQFTLVVLGQPEVSEIKPFSNTSDLGWIDLDVSWFAANPYASHGFSGSKVRLNVQHTMTYDPISVTMAQAMSESAGNTYRVTLGDFAQHSGIYSAYICGNFDLWYSADYVSGRYIYASGERLNADVGQDIRPDGLYASLSRYMLRYKGQTSNIMYDFGIMNDMEGLDRRLKYKIVSKANEKYLSVSADGTITVKAMPADELEADIRVTSMAFPELETVVTVRLKPLTLGNARIGIVEGGQIYSRYDWTMEKQKNSPIRELVFSIDDFDADLISEPVNFTVTGGRGLSLWDTDHDYDVVQYQYAFLASDGTAHLYAAVSGGGTYTIKAVTEFGKSAEMTVTVDGLSDKAAGNPTKISQIWIGGKAVTGWARYDSSTLQWLKGADALKNIDPSVQTVYYVDPSSKEIAYNGIYTINKKKYAFEEGNLRVVSDGTKTKKGIIDIPGPGYYYPVYADVTGEVLTGWQTIDGDEYYLDPDYGYLKTECIVPRGKGTTWVDQYGRMEGQQVETNNWTSFLEKDGLYRIYGSTYYWMKNGVIQTGWYYRHPDGTWDTKNSNVSDKIYLDPEDGGKLKTGMFTAGGKTYLAVPSMDEGKYISVNVKAGLHADYPEKYAIHPVIGKVIDSGGALVQNQMVKIAVKTGSVYETKYVYADEDGDPVKDTWIVLNKKKYYFDASGYLLSNAYGDSGFRIFLDEYTVETVYSKLKNENKPAEGFIYYRNEGGKYKKLTSVLLYDSYDQPAGMLDKNGNLAVSTAYSVKTNLYDTGTEMYLADAQGNIVRSSDPGCCLVKEAGSKYYAVDIYGHVQKNSTVPFEAVYYGPDWSESGWAMADQNGVLIRAGFKTVNDGFYGQYKVYFDEFGISPNFANMIYFDYATHTEYYSMSVKNKTWLTFRPDSNHVAFVIPGKTLGFKTGWQGGENNPIYLNSDGSIKTGFVRNGSRFSYIGTIGYSAAVLGNELLYGNNLDNAPVKNVYYSLICRIGGKLYFFDMEGKGITGWVHFDYAAVIDADKFLSGIDPDYKYIIDGYMYFSEKDGHALTGANKVPVPEVVNGAITLGSEEVFGNGEKRVNTSGRTDTLYFSSNGLLIHGTNTVISGKLVTVEADGTKSAGKEHWFNAFQKSYVLKNGELAKGRKKIGDAYYYFDTDTGLKVTNQLRKTGSKWYYYGQNGRQETPYIGWADYVSTDEGMQYVCFDSTTGKTLSAVWNSDGSLKKIVYTATGRPAAGESIVLGIWDTGAVSQLDLLYAGVNGYVLDSKGLPKTGLVTGFTSLEFSDYTAGYLNTASDGRKIMAGDVGAIVKIGSKYYLQEKAAVVPGYSGIFRISDWSALPESDRKALDTYLIYAKDMGMDSLYVMVNEDRSIAANTVRTGNVSLPSGNYYGSTEISGEWHTNRLGVILELVSPIFRYGGKTRYSTVLGGDTIGTSSGYLTLRKMPEETDVYAIVRFDGTGLKGFFDEQTGKALNGTYLIYMNSSYVQVLWLKNGKPQSGTKSIDFYGYDMKFDIPADLAGAVPGMLENRPTVILE